MCESYAFATDLFRSVASSVSINQDGFRLIGATPSFHAFCTNLGWHIKYVKTPDKYVSLRENIQLMCDFDESIISLIELVSYDIDLSDRNVRCFNIFSRLSKGKAINLGECFYYSRQYDLEMRQMRILFEAVLYLYNILG